MQEDVPPRARPLDSQGGPLTGPRGSRHNTQGSRGGGVLLLLLGDTNQGASGLVGQEGREKAQQPDLTLRGGMDGQRDHH